MFLEMAGTRSLEDKRADSKSIRFLIAVVQASLLLHVESQVLLTDGQVFFFPGFSGFLPTFVERSARYK